MPQEMYDAASALLTDDIAPLFRYKFGSVEFDVFPSSALEGSESFGYVESQLFAAAIATEYNELREKSQAIMDSTLAENGGNGLTREIATEYAHTLKEMQEKGIELDNWTVKYIEAMAKLTVGEFATLLSPEIEKFNKENNKNLTLSKLVNNLYQRINEELKTITVESDEEQEAKLYDQPGSAELEGKPQGIEPSINIENTVNGLPNVSLSFTNASESFVPIL